MRGRSTASGASSISGSVSISSKTRSQAAIASCRLPYALPSTLSGRFIEMQATMKVMKSPVLIP